MTSLNVFDNVDKAFLTLLIIIGLTSILYRFMGRFNKPIVLGGLIAGAIIANLHLPKQYFDLDSCSVIGDIGIILFMMLMGTYFDFSIIREKKSTLFISILSVLTPFICGFLCAPWIYPLNADATLHLSLLQFSLLLGISISIAAFSLTSLFLSHSHMIQKRISHIALLCASMDDVLFWLIFGSLLLYFQTNAIVKINESLIFSIYIASLIFIFPPLVRKIANRIQSERSMLAFLILGCFASAICADAVDLHQIFGAFAFGLMLPNENPLILTLRSRLEVFISVLMLPVFFAKLGAVVDISMITNKHILWLGLILSVIAFCAKFIGVYFGARLLKYPTYEAAFLSSVLNIRGIVEVVVMKIAWEVGLISFQIFTILIIVAIFTGWFATTVALHFKKKL